MGSEELMGKYENDGGREIFQDGKVKGKYVLEVCGGNVMGNDGKGMGDGNTINMNRMEIRGRWDE